MKIQEQLGCEIKICKVMKENDAYILEEYDKDGNTIDKYSIEEILNRFINKSYVKIKIDYSKDLI